MPRHARHDDVRPAHQPNGFAAVLADHALHHIGDPGAGGIDQRARRHLLAGTIMVERDLPMIAPATGRHDPRARQDARAPRLGIAGVQHDQTGIFDPAIGIFIGLDEFGLQRRTFGCAGKVQGGCARQDLAPAQMVIEEQAQPDQPIGPAPAQPWHDRTQKP